MFAESESFKQFCKILRPAYKAPSRKQIAGPLLDQDFAQIQAEIKQKIHKSNWVKSVSHGWSNIRNEHVVNFLVIIPSEKKPLYYRALFAGATVIQPKM